MLIIIKFPGNVYNLMRDCGYHPHQTSEKRTEQLSFIRRLGSADYPRFHVYVSKSDLVSRETNKIRLHLDQKKPIYKGVRAHSGEYKGELVEKEAERIKQIAEGP